MKKVISLFLAIIMILSIGTVGVSAYEFTDYVWIYTSRQGAQIDNYLYFPVYYDDDSYYACNGDEDAKVKITLPFFYDPEVLKPVAVTPSELLYGMNFTGEITEIGVWTDTSDPDVEITYPYFYADITFDGDTRINKGEVLFNVKMEVIGNLGNYNVFFDYFFLVEDLEQEKMTCCKWEVIDGDGNVAYDISSQIWQNGIMDEVMGDGYILEGYEPFIPPVEDDNVENGIYDRITISSDVYHARKGDYAYFPVYYDCKTAYSEIADNDSGSSTKIILAFLYNDHLIEPVEAIPSEQLYNIGGTTEIIRVDKYEDEDTVAIPYIYVEVNFDGCIDINNDVLFNVKFEVISDNFFDEYGRLDMGGLFDEFWLVDDDNVLTFHFSEWKINKSNGNVKNISPYVTTNSASQFTSGTYDDLLLKNYEPFIPPVEEGKLTADTKFESGETYYINNYEDFKIFIDLINAGQTGKGSTFELTSDIIINHGTFSLDENNEPLYVGYPITANTILTECESGSDFRGTLDGKNHSIMGYYSTTSGIFDLVYGGKVKNLCIKNSLFDLRGSSVESAGSVAAKADNVAEFRNVIFNGIIINDGANTGGIVGMELSLTALFYNCRNRGTVIGADYCGGIIGKITRYCTLSECVNNGTVISTGNYVGGLVANITPNVNVTRSANAGTVKSTGNYVGGIAGDISLDSNKIEDCYHTGIVSGNDYVGGLGGNFYSAGDNLEEYWAEYDSVKEERLWYGETLQELYGGDAWIEVWPPVWADDYYMELWDEETAIYDEILANMPEKNCISLYSAGSVTANGSYVGGIFGGFDGCVLRFTSLYYNYNVLTRATGKCKLELEQDRITNGEVNSPTPKYDSELKTEQFAKSIGSSGGLDVYLVDETNENNGYVILKRLLSDETEPGYTDITQNVTDLKLGTTGTITFASDETKTYKFTPETDGDYKVTVLGKDKTLAEINTYKNGELLKEGFVATTDEYPAYEAFLKPVSKLEIDFEGLIAGEEIVIKITDSINKTIAEEPTLKFYTQYFMPSSISITVENTTPVEEEPLFEFGVTSQHIRNKFDMVYYPASFGFSMYDDANIRYSDICADVADLAFGCDTEVVMKYIYDATTLDFVSVYEDFWEGSVEVLEHGSTGETGPDGQEYNYIVIKAKFIAVGYANDTAPYYLKFAVIEDNFINSDGTVRKVIDNVPYSEDQLCVWNAWDAKGNSFDFSDKIKFKSSDYETDGYTYDNLLLEDDLIPTDVSMPTVTFTPEHARKDDLAYYPCMYDSNVDYEEWVHSATGFKDSTTKIQIKVNYDSSTLELLDALPSKELYDLGGTVTIIETGDLYPDDPGYSHIRYAVVQIEFDALDFEEGCLFSLKFRVLQENFLDEEGRPIDLVNSFVADWVVTNNDGKSHDLRYYVSSSYVGFQTFGSYEELILADYEPFDPILLTDVTEVTYVQQEDTRKTFTVTVNGRKQMIQFIEPDGGTRTYDRYNKNVKITSYNADGQIVSAMARDLAYEVWEIYSNMSVGVEIQVRGKENYKWDEFRYSFTIEPYNPIISMELSATSGKKGAVPATVIADEKTEKVMFKMPNGTSVTVASTATDENGNKIFIGNAWMNEDGLNEIEVKIYRKNVWKPVGTLEYTVE